MSTQRKGYRTCAKCGRNRAAKFFLGERGRVCTPCKRRRTNIASREVRLLTTYGISLDEYDELLARQDGKCAICRRSPRYNLDVDHDHAMEKALRADYGEIKAIRMSIRGLLCKLCNRRLLPSVRDNIESLDRAIRYLNDPPAFQVISTVSSPPPITGATPPNMDS